MKTIKVIAAVLLVILALALIPGMVIFINGGF